ncbi:hypothetical protein ACIQXV_00865 [Neobacillus sp. NPDC097160]|uniref:hypothetical protein n=1 Tax=Neobacillus sp. NPDC097160 TaxID=3364298 RepID=UPI0038089DC7
MVFMILTLPVTLNSLKKRQRKSRHPQFPLFGQTREYRGYWVTGRKPIRAEGTDNRLPMLGDGSQDWQGIAGLARRRTV